MGKRCLRCPALSKEAQKPFVLGSMKTIEITLGVSLDPGPFAGGIEK